VSTRAAIVSGLVTAGLVLLAMWVFELSADRAMVLAPVIVVAVGAAAGVAVLWAKVGWESLKRSRRPWLWVWIGAGAVVVIAALSLLGIELPRE
jgi:cytochrome bd-type quinol oxidase subunit 2